MPDRVRVFVSSTIDECATERAAAQAAILGVHCVPVLFERAGARSEPPRDFYLRKLHDADVVIGIYRTSYGWIDAAKGMTISGLEDEYREVRRLERYFLAYVLKTAPGRDPKLGAMIADMKGGPYVVSFFEDGDDLEDRIRDDLVTLIAEGFARAQGRGATDRSAASVLSDVFRGKPLKVRRTALLDRLTQAASLARVVWVVGEPGSGKTALAAEWAEERKAAYVAARGLDPRAVLLAGARALGVAGEAESYVPLFDDARSLLIDRWSDGRNWPLVLDDPDDLDALWPVLATCLGSSGGGSVVLITRDPGDSRPGERLRVVGVTSAELEGLPAIAGIDPVAALPGASPAPPRAGTTAEALSKRYEALPAALREAVGYIALSPVPLSLGDVGALLGPTADSALWIADALRTVDDIVIDAPTGYEFVNAIVQARVAGAISRRPQLRAMLADRLATRLAGTDRSWAAFTLRRDDDPALAERLANRSVREAVFTGSTRRMAEALEFLATRYRDRIERGPLLSVLLSLAEVRTSQGRSHEVPGLLREAMALATGLGDEDARSEVEILSAGIELRGSISRDALERVRALRVVAETDDRPRDAARLLLEEGVAFLGVGDVGRAVPAFREARTAFGRVDDAYGAEIATRNLIASLAQIPGGAAESDRLRFELRHDGTSPRDRAWLCNLAVPILRREGRIPEAEAKAREAIAIGEDLGDAYVVAVNQCALGNVLREAGRLEEALTAFDASGRMARSIGRIDLEGRSRRLSAMTENEWAEAESEPGRGTHAARSEGYATQAIGLLSASFAKAERARALEERGAARLLLGREADALADYADAVAGYLDDAEADDAGRLLPFMAGRCEGRDDAVALIARALGAGRDRPSLASEAWVGAIAAALRRCPEAVAPGVLGVLVRQFLPGTPGDWWFQCLIRCLLLLDRHDETDGLRGLGPTLLMSVLAFGPHRRFMCRDLLTLAALCFDRSHRVTARHRPGEDLNLIVRVGPRGEALFTVRTTTEKPEQVFVALFVASFLAAFGDELSAILYGDGLPEGLALDVVVFTEVTGNGALREFLAEGVRDKPVATARMEPEGGEEVPIVLIVRNDAMEKLAAERDRGGEIEVMLARFVQEILHATLGASLDDAIYASKVRDLLVRFLGR